MASKLGPRLLAVREFILKIFKKDITITTTVFKKFIKIMEDKRNIEITEKYGERLYSSLLSEYKFKGHKDYTSKMALFKQTQYADTSFTQYGEFHSIITKKIFDNDTVKIDWIIEDMSQLATQSEVRYIIKFIFSREDNISKVLNDVLQITQHTKSSRWTCESIIENALSNKKFKDSELIQSIFDREFGGVNLDKEIVVFVKRHFQYKTAHKSVLRVVQQWLYLKTKDEDYLSDELKDIFIF